jgi:hypothetical protein
LSPAARAGKEKQDNVLQQLAAANENTWMLIGKYKDERGRARGVCRTTGGVC